MAGDVPEWVPPLMGKQVTVTSPTGARWAGELVGYCRTPTVLIRTSGGLVALPAAHTVAELVPGCDPHRCRWPLGSHAPTCTLEPREACEVCATHTAVPLDGTEDGWRCSCGRTFTSSSGYARCPDVSSDDPVTTQERQ